MTVNRVTISVGALVTATVTLSLLAIVMSWTGSPRLDMWCWFAVCLTGELLWLRLPLDRATVSMAACFNFTTLLLLSRSDAMLAVALSVLAAELIIMRKPLVRSLFNAAQSSLAAGAASLTIAALSGGSNDPAMLMANLRLLPLVAGAACYYAVNRTAVSLAIGVSQGISPLKAWRVNFGNHHELLSSATLFSLGVLVAVCHRLTGIVGAALAVLPLVIACDAYRRQLESAVAPLEPCAQTKAAA